MAIRRVIPFLSSLLWVSLVVESPLVPVSYGEPRTEGRRLPTIHSVKQLRKLTMEESKHGYPLRLRGVVTYYDHPHGDLFLQDSTGGVYITPPTPAPALHPGQYVEVEGISKPSDLLSDVAGAKIRVLSETALPAARRVPAEELSTIRHDCERVEVEGVVRSVNVHEGGVMFDVIAGTVQFKAYIPNVASLPADFVDAFVRIRGTCGGFYNSRDQFLAPEVLVPTIAGVTIVEKPPENYASLPVTPIRSVLHPVLNQHFVHRVRVQGIVMLQRLGRSLFIYGRNIGLLVRTSQMTALKVGDRVDAAGFPAFGDYAPVLQDAVVWRSGSGLAPRPVAVTADQALAGNYDAELIRVSGRLVETSLKRGYRSLVMQSGNTHFEAEIDDAAGRLPHGDLDIGGLIEVTGICVIHVNEAREPDGFTVVLRSPADIKVLLRSPWWTVARAMAVAAFTGVVILVVLGWVVALRRRVLERTKELLDQVNAKERALADLAETQRRMVEMSRLSGMAEVATGVLHNVGNVLNSVNVSASIVAGKVRESRLTNLVALAGMLQEHAHDLPDFLTRDPKGQRVVPYLVKLGTHLEEERQVMVRELELLTGHVGHIKEIVATQQSYAKVSGLTEVISLAELVEDALRIVGPGLERHQIRLERDFQEIPPAAVDKHAVLQILLNLLRNAKQAVKDSGRADGRIVIRLRRWGEDRMRVAVEDTGVGLPPENLTRIFSHGFTTRRDGHGFGLHSGANAAQHMGGTLWAESDGPGRGATFTLELPLRSRKKTKAQPAREAVNAAPRPESHNRSPRPRSPHAQIAPLCDECETPAPAHH